MYRFKLFLTGLLVIFVSTSCSSLNGLTGAEFNINSQEINPQRCGLKPVTGMCKAAFRKYYFNNETQVCEPFIWGGCDDVVPFESFKSCQASCEK
jgi:hypothetical protein